METPRIAVCIPNGGTIKTLTISCLIDALSITPYERLISMPIGGYPGYSRGLSAQNALEVGATHLMIIDNDMIFPPDGIQRLLALNKDIVGANYFERRHPLIHTVKMMDENENLIAVSGEDIPKELFKCYAVGTGFILINMDVFRTLTQPFFNAPTNENGELTTEDVFFCVKARKAGFDVWCDPTLVLRHIGDYLY